MKALFQRPGFGESGTVTGKGETSLSSSNIFFALSLNSI
jgi:hypothetical protein